MANTFRSYQSTSVTTEATVLTGPSSTQTTVIGLSIANTGAGLATVSVKLNTAYIVKDAPVPVGGSLVAIGGEQKVVVEATDTIKVSSDVTVDVITSTLEIT
jgi:hypothetical protein